MVEKTGRSRFRIKRGWLGGARLIFQLEETGNVTRLLAGQPDTERETWWRDVTLSDLTTSRWEVVR